ncbi:MAG: hypothetical protein IKH49_07960 [Bacteroidales bacterium]|nr:hypothetical protein [Bacteroidales bacterium]
MNKTAYLLTAILIHQPKRCRTSAPTSFPTDDRAGLYFGCHDPGINETRHG